MRFVLVLVASLVVVSCQSSKGRVIEHPTDRYRSQLAAFDVKSRVGVVSIGAIELANDLQSALHTAALNLAKAEGGEGSGPGPSWANLATKRVVDIVRKKLKANATKLGVSVSSASASAGVAATEAGHSTGGASRGGVEVECRIVSVDALSSGQATVSIPLGSVIRDSQHLGAEDAQALVRFVAEVEVALVENGAAIFSRGGSGKSDIDTRLGQQFEWSDSFDSENAEGSEIKVPAIGPSVLQAVDRAIGAALGEVLLDYVQRTPAG